MEGGKLRNHENRMTNGCQINFKLAGKPFSGFVEFYPLGLGVVVNSASFNTTLFEREKIDPRHFLTNFTDVKFVGTLANAFREGRTPPVRFLFCWIAHFKNKLRYICMSGNHLIADSGRDCAAFSRAFSAATMGANPSIGFGGNVSPAILTL